MKDHVRKYTKIRTSNGKVDARFLILINLPVLKLSLPLLLECDNDEGDKDVDKEEREDDEEDDVEDRHLCPEESSGANVFKSGPHRVLQDTKKRSRSIVEMFSPKEIIIGTNSQ